MNMSESPWSVILAGGDARRMDGAIIRGNRLDRPKQFCRFRGSDSLLQYTIRRAARITDPERILVLVRESHRRWWTDELVGILPRKRGTERVCDVARFVEKPAASLAAELHHAGALWNSLILAGSAWALLRVFERSHPKVVRRCLEVLGAPVDDKDTDALFRSLPFLDFGSRNRLERLWRVRGPQLDMPRGRSFRTDLQETNHDPASIRRGHTVAVPMDSGALRVPARRRVPPLGGAPGARSGSASVPDPSPLPGTSSADARRSPTWRARPAG